MKRKCRSIGNLIVRLGPMSASSSNNNNGTNCPLPSLSWASNVELWSTMCAKESEYACTHDAHYMRRHAGIDATMRAILIDWLAEIAYAYRLHRETFHLAVEYFDRFMSRVNTAMRVDRLQLMGVTSLLLAAKVEEIYPPKLAEFAAHMEESASSESGVEDAIRHFELFMLKTLDWKISPVTANTWLMAYLQIGALNYHTLAAVDHRRPQQQQHQQSTTQPLSTHALLMPTGIYKAVHSAAAPAASQMSNLRDYYTSRNNKANTAAAAMQPMQLSIAQQTFYAYNYARAISLLDMCLFEMESLRFDYAVLAAAAMYHMLLVPPHLQQHHAGQLTRAATFDSSQLHQQQQQPAVNGTSSSQRAMMDLSAYWTSQCTGLKMHELDACIRWMCPYADVCKEMLGEQGLRSKQQLSQVDDDDVHNIQVYRPNLELIVS